jgi:putative addiction module killer protein
VHQVRITARLRQVQAGNVGDWIHAESDVSELRVHFGPAYRIYFIHKGKMIIVLLNGGDKSTQKRDIRRALKIAAQLGEEK